MPGSAPSSFPYTQADHIVIDDDDDDDDGIQFQGINPPPQRQTTSATTGPFAASMEDQNAAGPSAFKAPLRQAEDDLVQSTSVMGLGAPSSNGFTISPALLAPSQPQTSSPSPPGTTTDSNYERPLDSYKSGLVFDSAMMLHSNPIEDHPEQPVRIKAIFALLLKEGCVKQMKRIPCREALKREVALVHEAGIWDGAERMEEYDRKSLAEQTILLEAKCSLYVNEHSAFCARLSCGGAIELCDAIASGRIQNGLAVVRPPGHHAEPAMSMGFCFFNNVAVATRVLQQKYRNAPRPIKKVLILDWDVHHGNGTQRAFEEDANVLYISLHRYEDGEFYPGGRYGDATSVGTGAGEGKSVNVPWSTTHMRDADYLYAFARIVMPIAHEFSPDFVIISAGFDAAAGDPIGGNLITPTGYAHMAYQLASLAEGRLAVILEGGYNPDVIANCAVAVTKTILNQPLDPIPRDQAFAAPSAVEVVNRVARVQQKYWRSVVVPEMDSVDADNDPELPRIPLPELIKAHRTYELRMKYDFDEIPFGELRKQYRGQVFCSDGILSDFTTIVLFVHDMGNLRREAPSSVPRTAQSELAYLIDSSSALIDWARARNYGIIDVNTFTELPTMVRGNRPDVAAADVVEYIWDHFIDMSEAERVILVGHGTACSAITHLISQRNHNKVAAVVQVLGLDDVPEVKQNQADKKGLRKWYYQHSKVIFPANHPFYVSGKHEENPSKRYGKLERSREVRAIKTLIASMPAITKFIDFRVSKHNKQRLESGQRLESAPLLS